MNDPTPRASRRVRFEEVTPAHEYAAFFSVSIAPLVAHLGLPIFDAYDDLDDLQLAFLTLPSGETVTLSEYAGAPGTSLAVEVTMQNIPQIIFDSCQQLRVSRQELEWVHENWQAEFERLCAEHGEFEGIERSSTAEALSQNIDREPIDCFFHALEIYTRPKFPEHWAMLQHNLGLAYFDRIKEDRWENLLKSIACFNKSLEVFDRDKYPRKWQINQEDLQQSIEAWSAEKPNLIRDILDRPKTRRNLPYADLSNADLGDAILANARLNDADLSGAYLFCADLSNANLSDAILIGGNLSGANLSDAILIHANLIHVNLIGANLSDANLSGANLSGANLSDANLSDAILSGAYLSDANLSGANLSDANLSGARVNNAKFRSNQGISESMREELKARGAIFGDSPGDRSESRNLVPR